jgi:hypothetical protein
MLTSGDAIIFLLRFNLCGAERPGFSEEAAATGMMASACGMAAHLRAAAGEINPLDN